MAAALRLARDICSMAPVSAQLVKQLINASSGTGMASALEGMAGALAGGTQDAREGLASFRERRAPLPGQVRVESTMWPPCSVPRLRARVGEAMFKTREEECDA